MISESFLRRLTTGKTGIFFQVSYQPHDMKGNLLVYNCRSYHIFLKAEI